MKTIKQLIGKQGEDLASELYTREGYTVRDRNYLKKWGEIDLIVAKEGRLFFVEVKTVTRSYICNTTHLFYRAEENVHLYKAQRLKRTIQTYLLGLRNKRGLEWQFDLVVVVLNKEDLTLQSIERLENLIL